MLNSMTGYGKGVAFNEKIKVVVELKSVNHRYLDLSIKLPRKFNFLETNVRNTISSRVARGKMDVYISLEELKGSTEKIVVNDYLAKIYVDALKSLSEKLDIPNDVKASTLLRIPDIIEVMEEDGDEGLYEKLLMEALGSALDTFVEARGAEGERIRTDLLAKSNRLSEIVDELERLEPVIIEEYKERINTKLNELLEGITVDPARIAAEVVIYADKVCIDEEMVRLKSHVVQLHDILKSDAEVGKKLDFLAQELNRESNTILSKSTDAKIADLGIELKTLVEKIREQIQNLE